MKYISTRGQAPALNFEAVLLKGLAADGGLYVPETLPRFSHRQLASWSGLSYPKLAAQVLAPFVGDSLDLDQLQELLDKSYQRFRHPAVTSLQQLDDNLWVLELFHGPTLAFKDIALQFLGQLLDHFLDRQGRPVAIIGATSGDTGSAAIAGCYQSNCVNLFILHPHGAISEVQRRQMTTVRASNVHNIALEGSFDDCQAIVKHCFLKGREALPPNSQLIAINSINWARIMAQTVYYFYAALRLGCPSRTVSFAVPSGNFGNVYAGYLARCMGLPIEKLVVATNINDILHRGISDNDYSSRPLQQSLSPSMDIAISSNFERLLFDLYDRDSDCINDLMTQMQQGGMRLSEAALTRLRQLFSSCRFDDSMTLAEMGRRYRQAGYLLDPHSAIAVAAGAQSQESRAVPMICLATANPVKFPDAVKAAGCVLDSALSESMAELMSAEEAYQVLPNQRQEVLNFINRRLEEN